MHIDKTSTSLHDEDSVSIAAADLDAAFGVADGDSEDEME